MWQYNNTYSSELYHWGIKGQKWGVRRFQNEDGTLTPQGRIRYANDEYDRQRRSARVAYRKSTESGQDAKVAMETYKQSIRNAKDVRTIGRYQGEELKEIDKKYRYNDKRENRQRKELDKLRSKGASDEKIKKAESNLITTLTSKYFAENVKNIEKSVVMKRTISEIEEEKKAVGKAKASNALSKIGAATSAAVTGFGMYRTRDINSLKTAHRVNKEQNVNAFVDALMRANKEVRNS